MLKKVDLFFVPSNNHGCSGDWITITATTPTTGVVVSAQSCASCWQTGCTTDREAWFMAKFLGKAVALPNWSSSWDDASEILDDGSTFVRPDELVFC